jgi:hypothetical protein
VERKSVVKWNELPKEQMTVDDVLEAAETEGVTLVSVPEVEVQEPQPDVLKPGTKIG